MAANEAILRHIGAIKASGLSDQGKLFGDDLAVLWQLRARYGRADIRHKTQQT
jgi:hypothetical protein